ncbi:MAG TPA: GIY-YIG nuclease family protein [Verrucomicrobiota bacterium]|nr:GIY-YIG nuclease family protein [Verrucomicrobiota bacterium]
MEFYYVYILQSLSFQDCYYTGLTEDLGERLRKHNEGAVPHTRKFKPWRIKTAIAFTDRSRAAAFERYLKTSSGRAFARKRL